MVPPTDGGSDIAMRGPSIPQAAASHASVHEGFGLHRPIRRDYRGMFGELTCPE